MFFLFMGMTAHGSTEGDLPVQNHRLAPCPDSPNCVSSLEDSEKHSIGSYRYEKTLAEAKAMLKQVFGELSRTELVQEEEISLHYEVRSFLFRFVDDVEILFDDATKTIHFRSASRVGYSDFGVNRKRMEEVRSLLEGRL